MVNDAVRLFGSDRRVAARVPAGGSSTDSLRSQPDGKNEPWPRRSTKIR